MFKDLVLRTRSYRRFYENVAVDMATLHELVDLARLTASSGNRQPLKYVLACDPETNARIFSTLAWAGYLKDWGGPKEGDRPAAYIIIMLDNEVFESAGCDHGIAAQTIMLGATEKGLGGCIIASVKKPALHEALGIDECYSIMLVLALGKPKETVVVEALGPEGDIKYWRDTQGVHHVPKRKLEDIIVG